MFSTSEIEKLELYSQCILAPFNILIALLKRSTISSLYLPSLITSSGIPATVDNIAKCSSSLVSSVDIKHTSSVCSFLTHLLSAGINLSSQAIWHISPIDCLDLPPPVVPLLIINFEGSIPLNIALK